MGGFSPQPEGTGPIFPISSLLVAPVTRYSALLAPRTEKNWLPSPPSEVVLTGPGRAALLYFGSHQLSCAGPGAAISCDSPVARVIAIHWFTPRPCRGYQRGMI